MKELTTYSELTEGHGTTLLPGPLDGGPTPEQEPPLEEEEDTAKVSDEVRRGREQFLKIYQEKPGDEAGKEDEEVKEIRFKRETIGEEDMESGG
jgi:hypothetical protein